MLPFPRCVITGGPNYPFSSLRSNTTAHLRPNPNPDFDMVVMSHTILVELLALGPILLSHI